MRHLSWTSPHMKGTDVARLQRKLRIAADGDYGEVTARAVQASKYHLGFKDSDLRTGASVYYQEVLYGKVKRPADYSARAAKRFKAEHAPAGKGAVHRKEALEWLGERVGRVERDVQNRAEWLDKWEIANGHGRYRSRSEEGWPWCGIAIWASWKWGANVTIPGEVRSVRWVYNAARAGTHHLHVVKFEALRPGDWVILFSPDTHIATVRERPHAAAAVRTREGNTTPGTQGDQANGGGLHDRTRYKGQVVLGVRCTA